jgi:hypothetical protein
MWIFSVLRARRRLRRHDDGMDKAIILLQTIGSDGRTLSAQLLQEFTHPPLGELIATPKQEIVYKHPDR